MVKQFSRSTPGLQSRGVLPRSAIHARPTKTIFVHFVSFVDPLLFLLHRLLFLVGLRLRTGY